MRKQHLWRDMRLTIAGATGYLAVNTGSRKFPPPQHPTRYLMEGMSSQPGRSPEKHVLITPLVGSLEQCCRKGLCLTGGPAHGNWYPDIHISISTAELCRGGRFGRFTEQLNWYLSRYVRLEFAYGFGRLDRFDLKGDTQFFQSRLQLQF